MELTENSKNLLDRLKHFQEPEYEEDLIFRNGHHPSSRI
jgi:hypothetical protein